MTGVTILGLAEAAAVDRERLEELVDEYGASGAERLMGRTLEEIAVRLNQAERAWRRGDTVRLCHGARELSDVADRIGLCGLSRAGDAVSRVAMGADPVALAATVARMARIGEASLMSAWDVQNLSL